MATSKCTRNSAGRTGRASSHDVERQSPVPHECVVVEVACNVNARPSLKRGWSRRRATPRYGERQSSKDELMALRWEDVDLTANVIRVERSWDAIEGLIAPKSAKGTRRVPIASVLRDYLVPHRLSTGGRGLVFGDESRPFRPDVVTPRRCRVGGTPADHLARVQALVRQPDDRGGRQREGAEHVHGSREHRRDARQVRPSHARQRGRGGGSARRLPDGRDRAGGAVIVALSVAPERNPACGAAVARCSTSWSRP